MGDPSPCFLSTGKPDRFLLQYKLQWAGNGCLKHSLLQKIPRLTSASSGKHGMLYLTMSASAWEQAAVPNLTQFYKWHPHPSIHSNYKPRFVRFLSSISSITVLQTAPFPLPILQSPTFCLPSSAAVPRLLLTILGEPGRGRLYQNCSLSSPQALWPFYPLLYKAQGLQALSQPHQHLEHANISSLKVCSSRYFPDS